MMRIALFAAATATLLYASAARADLNTGTGAALKLTVLKKGELPAPVKAPDGLERAITFTDKNGLNVVVFASVRRDHDGDAQRSARLTVEHFAIKDGRARSVRVVKDGVDDCDLDVVADFIHGATAVTDLDGDGLAELTFAYRTACKGDVSPDTLKLLLLRDGEKWILRGDDRIEVEPGRRVGGTFKPDPPPPKWPAEFLAHAKKTWAKILSERK
jgi:hypothetical protein